MARFPPALSSPTSSNSHGDTPHTSPIHKQGPDVLPYPPRRGQLSQVPCGFEPIGGARLSERFSIDFCNQERALNLSILTVSGPALHLCRILYDTTLVRVQLPPNSAPWHPQTRLWMRALLDVQPLASVRTLPRTPPPPEAFEHANLDALFGPVRPLTIDEQLVITLQEPVDTKVLNWRENVEGQLPLGEMGPSDEVIESELPTQAQDPVNDEDDMASPESPFMRDLTPEPLQVNLNPGTAIEYQHYPFAQPENKTVPAPEPREEKSDSETQESLDNLVNAGRNWPCPNGCGNHYKSKHTANRHARDCNGTSRGQRGLRVAKDATQETSIQPVNKAERTCPCPNAANGCKKLFFGAGVAKTHARKCPFTNPDERDQRTWPCPTNADKVCDKLFYTQAVARNHGKGCTSNGG
ncbi:hypothetical protein HDK90DRAFT_515712 [Phyllosticta capitalensis]|uniref:C2H2-type domain-containing protein n=1 Tax=Phyllosticta capitalensis TaxID=121624 RepID=A0ABR1Y8K4_9PEZI